jgi:hypothetical protein
LRLSERIFEKWYKKLARQGNDVIPGDAMRPNIDEFDTRSDTGTIIGAGILIFVTINPRLVPLLGPAFLGLPST